MNQTLLIILIISALLAVMVLHLFLKHLNLWMQAMLSGAPVSMLQLIAMRLRRVHLRTVVYSHIRLVKAGIAVPVESLEMHWLAGGKVPNVASALITARAGKIDLDWDQATSLDSAGRDVLNLTQAMVESRTGGLVLTWQDLIEMSTESADMVRIVREAIESDQAQEARRAWRERITFDRVEGNVAPCIRGTRVPVSILLDDMASGKLPGSVAAARGVEIADIRAALAWAAERAREHASAGV